MSSKKVSYDRHFDKVGFLGQSQTSMMLDDQHSELNGSAGSGGDGPGGGGGSGDGVRRHSTRTVVRQTVIVVTFTLLANALLLGLFWSLVLKPVLHNSKSLNQQGGVYQILHYFTTSKMALFVGGGGNNNNNNWTAYIDEKCILVVDEVRSFKEAEEVCQKVGATVLSIDSPGEQAFLEEHLFVEKRVVNPVWLANQRRNSDDNDNDDNDNTELLYSNWLTDRVAARRKQQQVAAKMRVGNVIKRDSASCAEMLIGGHGHGHSSDNLEETAEETSTEQPVISSRSVAGAWTTVPCSKRNLIVCQKRQHLSASSWSAPEKLREELIRTRTRLLLLQRKEAAAERRTALFFASKEAEIRLRFEVLTNTTKVQLEDTVQAEVKRQLGSKYLEEQLRAAVQEAVQEKINRLAVEHKHSLSTSSSSSSSSLSSTHSSEDSVLLAIESAIPVGFIYLQLPKSKSPEELWPTAPFIWSDVSWTYSGVFFRVLGGSSAAFGEVQDGQAPHLDEVEAKMCIHKPNGDCTQLPIEETVFLPGKEGTGGWSGYVNTAGAYLYEKEAARLDRDALRFHVTGGEVRPRNMAIRVWKRTA
ncbi:hypothetical protein TYRP_003738 [Tyrophagus putrescentiae]|nr:hypothetical protein TYRP_003738 [Tyrophagus putrescentiae]